MYGKVPIIPAISASADFEIHIKGVQFVIAIPLKMPAMVFGKLEEFALHQCTFYECFKCKQPYFGGMQDCQQAMQSENSDALKPENLFCKECAQT